MNTGTTSLWSQFLDQVSQALSPDTKRNWVNFANTYPVLYVSTGELATLHVFTLKFPSREELSLGVSYTGSLGSLVKTIAESMPPELLLVSHLEKVEIAGDLHVAARNQSDLEKAKAWEELQAADNVAREARLTLEAAARSIKTCTAAEAKEVEVVQPKNSHLNFPGAKNIGHATRFSAQMAAVTHGYSHVFCARLLSDSKAVPFRSRWFACNI